MEIQRQRNLTTGILHTEIGHVYEDIEFLTGEKGIMTHMLPRANEAMKPILGELLKKVENSERFFNGKWDKEHTGEVDNATVCCPREGRVLGELSSIALTAGQDW